jgi:hypothetical protein
MKQARSTMVESGLGGKLVPIGGQFWFSAVLAAKDARNVTYKERICKTPWEMMYGSKKNVSDLGRLQGIWMLVIRVHDQRQKGKWKASLTSIESNPSWFCFRSQHERTQITT